MGEGKEQPSTITPCSSNRYSEDIPSTCPSIPNYMHGLSSQVSAWSPGFDPIHATYPFPHSMAPTPLENTTSSTAGELVGSDSNSAGGGETDGLCRRNEDIPYAEGDKDCNAGTSHNVENDGDDMIEEPNKGMEFNTHEDVQAVPGSTPFDPSGTQVRETVVQSQESMQFQFVGSQPLHYGIDGYEMDGNREQ